MCNSGAVGNVEIIFERGNDSQVREISRDVPHRVLQDGPEGLNSGTLYLDVTSVVVYVRDFGIKISYPGTVQ